MSKLKEQEALYEANKVSGRGRFCPRKGTYSIIEVYKGICYGQDTWKAKARWKRDECENYHEEFIVDLQLGSFKDHQEDEKASWTGREIRVDFAEYIEEKREFNVKYELVPSPTINIADLNRFLNSNNFEVIDSLLESTNGLDVEGENIDYEKDDWSEY